MPSRLVGTALVIENTKRSFMPYTMSPVWWRTCDTCKRVFSTRLALMQHQRKMRRKGDAQHGFRA